MGSEEKEGLVMVAVSKHSSSVSAVKWALSNKVVGQGDVLKLVHVRPPVRSIPTPMGNFVPVGQVSSEIVAAYMRDIQSKTEQHLQAHQNLCDAWKVQAEFVIVESDMVGKSLLDQISRLKVKKFIIGTSTCSSIIRRLKGSSIPEFIARHASLSCSVLVVSKGKLVSVKEARQISSSRASSDFNAELCSNDCNSSGRSSSTFSSSDGSSGSFPATQADKFPERRLFRYDSAPRLLEDSRGFVSQPLTVQREKAASIINLRRGRRSNIGPLQNRSMVTRPQGSHIFYSPFWCPDTSSKDETTLLCQGDCVDDGRPDLIACHDRTQSSEEGNFTGNVPSLNTAGCMEDHGSCRLNEEQESSQLNSKVSEAVACAVNHFPLALNEGLTGFSIHGQSITAAVQINRVSQHVVEDKQITETLSGSSLGDDSVVGQHDTPDEQEDVTDLEKLKLDLEVAQQRVMKAEQAAALATQKATELDAYAKMEAKKREQALILAQLARNEAAVEARKFDEALMALEGAKLAAEDEAERRREAEDRANKEASSRQKVMAALRQAKTKYREYGYEELEVATDGFSAVNQIGLGGYGPVYKGKLHHTTVAIKVLKKDSVQGPKEFQQEIELLSRMHHPHMVLLLGACPEKGCLVYEYLANGSLEDRLLCKGNTPPLPWHTRFRIAAEVASSLLFLHSSKPDPYVHRDLKPANILLDQNLVSKLGDVGLARLAPDIISYSITEYRETNPVGTFAYIDPEYQRTGVFTPRSDVYALGLVMLQLLTGKGPIGLTANVERALDGKTLDEVLDPTAGDWPIHEATEMACIAIQCSELRRKNRPDLETSVLPKLEKLRAFADDYTIQVAWSKPTVSESRRVVPSFFLCPISKELMEDPHIAADGFTYEYGAIKQWLQDHKTSPMTNLRLRHKQLTPNHSLRSAILEWKQRVACA